MGKYTDKIIHINATPEFLNNPASMEMLEKLCERAYHFKPTKTNMKKKVVYITEWVARDSKKEYPHGWGFDAPLVEFPQDADPAWVGEICRQKMSNDEFECIGAIPRGMLDGMFEVVGAEHTTDSEDNITGWNYEYPKNEKEYSEWKLSAGKV